jgi:hypothetical protein
MASPSSHFTTNGAVQLAPPRVTREPNVISAAVPVPKAPL